MAFDLDYYLRRFPHVIHKRYGRHFNEGFQEIENRFVDVRLGSRLLDVNDVMALFSADLPYVEDWTKPDLHELERKMRRSNPDVPHLIKNLGSTPSDRPVLKAVIDSLRELSLVALILHHVYPHRYAIVSHHLASTLHITGQTVPDFYLSYCEELAEWQKHFSRSSSTKTVAKTEFALWAWYRLANEESQDAKRHRDDFFSDRWIQRRRAIQIAKSLGHIGKMDLARSYLRTDPTVAAMIAWRQVELKMRELAGTKKNDRTKFHELLRKIDSRQLPRSTTKQRLEALWRKRNDVMHAGDEIPDAKEIVSGAGNFVEPLSQ
jgi:hypothetical protein